MNGCLDGCFKQLLHQPDVAWGKCVLRQETGLNYVNASLACRVQRVAPQQAFLLKAQMQRAFERVRVIGKYQRVKLVELIGLEVKIEQHQYGRRCQAKRGTGQNS